MVEGDRNNRSRSRSRVPLWNDSGRSCSRAPRPTSASTPEPGPSYNCYMNQASVVGCPCGLPGTQDWPTCVCWRFDHGEPSAERGVSSQHASSGGMEDIQALSRIPKNTKETKTKLNVQSLMLRDTFAVSVILCPRLKRKSWPV